MAHKTFRDLVIRVLIVPPLWFRIWLLTKCTGPLLWLLFHLESERVTVIPAGPKFCRYRMWYSWQSADHMLLGAYEPEVAEVLRREIAPGSFCIDVGAHAGYYAILMARLTGENGAVVAFEPVPVNFGILRRNVALNAIANVRLEPIGVSEKEGTFQLTLSSDQEFPKTASIAGHANGDRLKVIDIPTCSLDGYLKRTGKAPDLLLIDVEGAELAVLKGAKSTLQKARPKLLIELHNWDNSKRDEASEFLSTLGYRRTIVGYRRKEIDGRTLSEAFGFFQPSPLADGAGLREAKHSG